MKKKIQFNSIEERERLISENVNLFLIEEQNISEGNFLVFSETIEESKIIYRDVDEQEFNNLKKQNEELTVAAIDLAIITDNQNTKLEEQQLALIDLATKLAEVVNNG